jgi:hypothetical protein
MILFKQFYWLSCCHLTFRKIGYCLICMVYQEREVWGHINCFIKRGRFGLPLTDLSRGGGLWSHALICIIKMMYMSLITSHKQRLETYCFCSVSYYYYYYIMILFKQFYWLSESETKSPRFLQISVWLMQAHRLRRTRWLLVHSKVTLIRRFWLDEIAHYLYVHWSNRNIIHMILFIDFARKRKWNHGQISETSGQN